MRPRDLLRAAAAGGLAALLLAAAGCGEPDGADRYDAEGVPDSARYGGTAVVGGRGDIPSVNGLVSTDYVAGQVERFVLFLPLVRHGPELRPRPYLARSWELADDSTRVTFRLREDVRWHDGEPVTAADVAFTFRRAKDPDVGYPNRSYFADWDSVEVLDRHTVRFRVRPTAGLLYGWTRLPVLPEHVLGDVPPSDLAGHPFGTRRPVGDGPFRFVERRAGDRWVFEANPDFPEELGGRPYLDRLVYRVVPEATTLLRELRRGGVHFVMDLPPSQLEEVRGQRSTRAETFTFPDFTALVWNTRRPLFEDVRVRRALALALDRQEIVGAVRGGLGRQAAGPVGPWHWAHDPEASPLPHAPDSARGLLEGAGWRDADGDGVREREGREFRFELLVNPSPDRRDIAVMVQEHLARVGVAVEPRTVEWAALGRRVTHPDRDFDAFVLGITQDLVFDDRPFWCGNEGKPFAFTGYCPEALAAVLDSIPSAVDRDRRRRLLRTYNERAYRGQAYTYLFFEERVDALRRELQGVELDARGDLVSVDRWWLLPSRR